MTIRNNSTYDEDQLERDEPQTNNLIELESVRLRVTQLEKKIEL